MKRLYLVGIFAMASSPLSKRWRTTSSLGHDSLGVCIALMLILNVRMANASFIIDMEGLVPSASSNAENNSTRVFGDFTVFITHGHFWEGGHTRGNRAYNGTDYLINDDAEGIVISHVDGTPFTLSSFQAAEYLAFSEYSTFPPGEDIEVTAVLSGGGTMSTTFTMDGVPTDGPGGNLDFETFALPPGWTGLMSVTILNYTPGFYGGIMAWDNIAVMAVPEPGTLTLTTIALLAMCCRRRIRA